MDLHYDIEIVSAPSILGLRSNGVDLLAETLLRAGLAHHLQVAYPVVQVPTLNEFRSGERDAATHCLNPQLIHNFSLDLSKAVNHTLDKRRFALVLGGDCSLLAGIMPALKARGHYGLIFIDAHADFYSPETSTTGEVADMDLAIVTGRGPSVLTNINNQQPYVPDKHVVHIGQRDWEETQHYGSPDIRDTAMRCFSFDTIEEKGTAAVMAEVLEHTNALPVDGFWIHFDTDVLADDINPAVDYRLPGGLQFEQATYIVRHLLLTGRIAGMSVTIFNPILDTTGTIAPAITTCIGQMFS